MAKKTPIKEVDEVSGEIEATEVKNESEKYDPMELVEALYFKDIRRRVIKRRRKINRQERS